MSLEASLPDLLEYQEDQQDGDCIRIFESRLETQQDKVTLLVAPIAVLLPSPLVSAEAVRDPDLVKLR